MEIKLIKLNQCLDNISYCLNNVCKKSKRYNNCLYESKSKHGNMGDFNATFKHTHSCLLNSKDGNDTEKIDIDNLQTNSDKYKASVVILNKLLEESTTWPLPVERWSIQTNYVSIFLNRKKSFSSVLSCVLDQKEYYGVCEKNGKEILLTSGMLPSDIDEMNLSQLRLHYMRSLVYNLLECNGYTVIQPQERKVSGSVIQIHLALSSSNSALLNRHEVVCASVVNSKHDAKEDSLLARHYLKQRTKDLELMSRHKYGEQVVEWGEYLQQLGEAVIKVDLLHVKPGKVIPLDLQPTTNGRSRHTSCKGAAFVLYNCARLAAIFKQFDDKVAEGYYPHFIPLQDVDFSLLKQEEEWTLLCKHLLFYPNILENSVREVESGIIEPQLLSRFLMSLCANFSIYYRRVRILTEPRNHLLPVMFARLYLLKGIEQVLHNALRIMDITPLTQM